MSQAECPSELKELQSWMRWLVTDPRGVEGALECRWAEIETSAEPAPRRLGAILSTETLGSRKRLSIYAEGYFIRLVEATSEDFPALYELIGYERFHDLLGRYLRRYPSRGYTVAEVGRSLHTFIRETNYAPELPYLADLAQLEWVILEAFYSPDSPVFDPTALSGVAQEEWPGLSFQLDGSARLLESAWPIHTLWENRAVSVDSPPTISRVLVHRVAGAVRVTPLEAYQWICLRALERGAALSEVCELLARELPALDNLQAQFFTSFGEWVAEGVISSVKGRANEPVE